MSAIKTGCPALSGKAEQDMEGCSLTGGMTLRDYATIKFMAALLSNPAVVQANMVTGFALANCDEDSLAIYADGFVDAMLAARNAKK